MKVARSQTALHREVVRAKALLAAADGVANTWIAADLENNDDPKPLVWTATAESILEKVRRGRVALDRVASHS